jgi:hypothetical protein
MVISISVGDVKQFAEVFIKQPLTNIVKITAIKNLDYIFLFDVVKKSLFR